eukprot:CFRG1139T1
MNMESTAKKPKRSTRGGSRHQSKSNSSVESSTISRKDASDATATADPLGGSGEATGSRKTRSGRKQADGVTSTRRASSGTGNTNDSTKSHMHNEKLGGKEKQGKGRGEKKQSTMAMSNSRLGASDESGKGSSGRNAVSGRHSRKKDPTTGRGDASSDKVSRKSKRSQTRPKKKVVVRRLPSNFTKESALETLETFTGAYSLFYFVSASKSLKQHGYCRFYVDFKTTESVRAYSQLMSSYSYADSSGTEVYPVIEYAPNQTYLQMQQKNRRRVGDSANGSSGKPRRIDHRINTIEADADYKAFLESLNVEPSEKPNANVLMEQREAGKLLEKEVVKDGIDVHTPLLDYLRILKTNRKGGSGSSGDKRSHRKGEKSTSASSSSVSSTTKKKKDRERREEIKVYSVKKTVGKIAADGTKSETKKNSIKNTTSNSEIPSGSKGGSMSSAAKKKKGKSIVSSPAPSSTTNEKVKGTSSSKHKSTKNSIASESRGKAQEKPSSDLTGTISSSGKQSRGSQSSGGRHRSSAK